MFPEYITYTLLVRNITKMGSEVVNLIFRKRVFTFDYITNEDYTFEDNLCLYWL